MSPELSAFADGEPVMGSGEASGAEAVDLTVAVAVAAAAVAVATTGAVMRASLNPGGSSKIGYSRNRRPAGQFISTSTSRNGSLMGALLTIFKTGVPLARRSVEKRNWRNNGVYSMRASP